MKCEALVSLSFFFNHLNYSECVKSCLSIYAIVILFGGIRWNAIETFQPTTTAFEYVQLKKKHPDRASLEVSLSGCVRGCGRAKISFLNNWSRKTGAAVHVFKNSRDSRQIDTRCGSSPMEMWITLQTFFLSFFIWLANVCDFMCIECWTRSETHACHYLLFSHNSEHVRNSVRTHLFGT